MKVCRVERPKKCWNAVERLPCIITDIIRMSPCISSSLKSVRWFGYIAKTDIMVTLPKKNLELWESEVTIKVQIDSIRCLRWSQPSPVRK